MKKKLLSILFIIICLPISVFAKDKPFYNKFQTKDLDIDSQFSTYVDTIELNNSFITLNPYSDPYNDDEYAIILTKYDYDGEIIGQSKIENFYLWNVTNDDNYLYLLCESFDDLELKKIDTNLNIIKSYTFTEEEYEEIYNSYYYINSENSINVKGNKINILGESSILQLNLDLTTCYENTNYNAFYQLYPKTAKAMDLETEIYDSNDSYQVYLYENSGTPVVYSADSYTSIILLNKNGDELWRKKVNRYLNNNITNI